MDLGTPRFARSADASPHVTADTSGDEVSLRPYFLALLQYRTVIAMAILAVSVTFMLVAAAVYVYVPVERLGSLRFRLLFTGAAQGQYPSGTPFSPSDVVSTEVLTDVYRTNALSRFGSYEAFKESVFVLAANPEVDLLAYEYQSKLADPTLTPVDRARLEDDFRRKREDLTDPVYSLNFRRQERFETMPADLMQKVVNDTLNVWARSAHERKGATGYDIAVLSNNILRRDELQKEDYLVSVDILRTKANRVIQTIDELSTLPGADAIRSGDERISLAEVRSNLEDVIRFKLEPLFDLIRSEGVTRNVRELTLYASNQLFQLQLERQRAESLIRVLKESLNSYTPYRLGGGESADADRRTQAPAGAGFAPQLDQTFLDKLMTLSTAEADQAYRRGLTDRVIRESEKLAVIHREAAFYEDVVNKLARTTARTVGTPETVAFLKTRTDEAFAEVSKAIDQTSTLYRDLSVNNLNPAAKLYSVSSPFYVRTQRTVTVRQLAVFYGIVLLGTLIITPVGCLLHYFFPGERRPAAVADTADFLT